MEQEAMSRPSAYDDATKSKIIAAARDAAKTGSWTDALEAARKEGYKGQVAYLMNMVGTKKALRSTPERKVKVAGTCKPNDSRQRSRFIRWPPVSCRYGTMEKPTRRWSTAKPPSMLSGLIQISESALPHSFHVHSGGNQKSDSTTLSRCKKLGTRYSRRAPEPLQARQKGSKLTIANCWRRQPQKRVWHS
jgi:hypothetical protein